MYHDRLFCNCKALDGVTTALDLEFGVYPVGEWYKMKQNLTYGKPLINYGAAVGHIPVRIAEFNHYLVITSNKQR